MLQFIFKTNWVGIVTFAIHQSISNSLEYEMIFPITGNVTFNCERGKQNEYVFIHFIFQNYFLSPYNFFHTERLTLMVEIGNWLRDE